MNYRLFVISIALVFALALPAFAQGNSDTTPAATGDAIEIGGRIAPFVYIPTGADIKGAGAFTFQPFFVFDDDFNLYGANLVFSSAGSGFYFPVALVDLDNGEDGVMFGAGYNRFFESGATNGRWLGDVHMTHVTEIDTTSLSVGMNHIWYMGSAITYLGANVNAGFGDSDGFGYGGVGGVKFSLAENFILELQGQYRSFEGESGANIGASLGIQL
jgi:hypothetical protein